MKLSLKKRLLSAFVLSVIVLTAAFLLPSILIFFVITALAILALLEFYKMLDVSGIPCFRIVGTLSGIVLIAATFFPPVLFPGSANRDWELIALAGMVVVMLIRMFPQKHNTQLFQTLACTLLGVLYVPFLFNFITRLAFAYHEGGLFAPMSVTGRRLGMYLLVVVKLTDVGAYFIGSAFGKRKLFPRISPGKTWTGFAGGISTGLFCSLMFYVFSGGSLGVFRFSLADSLILGVILPVTGIVGDLAESMLKRISGRKDSGSILPGMGGVLDTLDSLLFAAPVLFIYVSLFFRLL